MTCVTMPFGKYKGDPVDKLPSSYLCWLVTIKQTRENFKLLDACVKEIGVRSQKAGLLMDLLFEDVTL